ncbi:MAG: PHP domain-containing protein [Acidobacteriota bacterium]|nr:PHP domain-containing protein [Acidobacteriota bacterium]
MSLAQLLSVKKENPFRVKAYRRAARTIRALGDSLEELVREEADLTTLAGIGKGIESAIREIVLSGASRRLEALRAEVSPEVAAISEYPGLDPAWVLRIYKKLKISSVEALKEALANGEIAKHFGARMESHVRGAVTETHLARLYDAGEIAQAAEEFLIARCAVRRAEVGGDFRRKVEVINEISFVIETADFQSVLTCLQKFGGGSEMLSADAGSALFKLASGILLRIQNAAQKQWGLAMVLATGSDRHLEKLGRGKLSRLRASYPDEAAVYKKLGLTFIPPELREGGDEVELAGRGALPVLITRQDIRGELHAHSTSSDGAHTIEQMGRAAAALSYEYTGITDHSKSLKIAGGVTEEDLWKQLRFIDRINAKNGRIQILKSAEVDILADGTLDYTDDLLKELDYTVCSIHSKFALGREEQTERIMRAMDNRYFTILGHATGRMLLKRPGYEIDLERIAAHALKNGCFFEINSSPDRLDLSASNARLAREAGVKIAITTDAHSMREFELVECGIEQARRAGLNRDSVLNTRPWPELQTLFRR